MNPFSGGQPAKIPDARLTNNIVNALTFFRKEVHNIEGIPSETRTGWVCVLSS